MLGASALFPHTVSESRIPQRCHPPTTQPRRNAVPSESRSYLSVHSTAHRGILRSRASYPSFFGSRRERGSRPIRPDPNRCQAGLECPTLGVAAGSHRRGLSTTPLRVLSWLLALELRQLHRRQLQCQERGGRVGFHRHDRNCITRWLANLYLSLWPLDGIQITLTRLCAAANPVGASRLQSLRPTRRVAELGSFPRAL